MLAITELQTCVYKYLTGLGLSVHSTIPIKTAKLPYVQIVGFDAVSNHTKTNNCQDYILRLAVWIVDDSQVEFYKMMGMVASIEEAELELDGDYSIGKISLETMGTLQEEYEHRIIQHGILEFRFTIFQL